METAIKPVSKIGRRKILIVSFAVLVAPIFVILAAMQVGLITIRLRENSFPVRVSKASRESDHFGTIITRSHRNLTADQVVMKIKADPWARAHISGRFGLGLVDDAAASNRFGILRRLLAMGAPADGVVYPVGRNPEAHHSIHPSWQSSPLYEAVNSGNLSAIRLLLVHGADPYRKMTSLSVEIVSPYSDALASKNPKIIAIFKELNSPTGHKKRSSP